MKYEKKFLDNLIKNIGQLEGKLTVEEGHLTQDIKNTCYWAQALQNTFSDMGDIAGMLGMSASCDYTPIK